MAQRPGLVFARLHPPRPLSAKAVEAFLLRLASDPTHALVVFEARSHLDPDNRDSQTGYWIGAPPEHVTWIRRTLHDLLPGAAIQPEQGDSRTPVTGTARVKIRPHSLALATDRPEATSLAILSALNQRLDPGEELVIQLIVGPRRSPRHRQHGPVNSGKSWWQTLVTGRAGSTESPAALVKQHEARVLMAGMATCIRLGVTAPTSDRRRRLLVGLLGGLSTAKTPNTFVRLRPEHPNCLDRAKPPLLWEIAPAASELVGLLAWPLGDGELPGLPPLHPRQLPLPIALRSAKEHQRVIGVGAMPGDNAPVGLAAHDGLFHLIATGPTGSGKSTVLLHLIRADIQAGRAVVVIDPKRQLIDDIIERAVPEDRINDVVVVDPSDPLVPGFNPLDAGGRDPDVVADGLLAVFAAVFADGWGPRTQDMTASGLISLLRVGQIRSGRGDEPYTLLDLPRLFSDGTFRRSVVGHVASDPALGAFWAWYDGLSPQAQAAAIAAPANKWRQYLLRPAIRRILGQAAPTFRLRDVFRENKVVLVPLNDGLIGPITAQLLGGLIVSETWMATLERAKEKQPTARPASVWVDEVQNYLHLPTSLGDALAASRSMGVAWALAHQFRAQLPPAMLSAIDSNARNKIIFRPGDPKEAAAYARMTPELDAVDFMSLGKYEAYATVMTGGAQQPWCSIRTMPMPEPTGLGERIRTESRNRYGAAPATDTTTEVEGQEKLSPRQELIGRKRRGKSR